jgi:hypothetical protein
MILLTQDQFEKSKMFIFRYGRLLDRKRFMYHFENGSKDEVLQVLSCYQNSDGGFGHGLEMDVTCPASTAICAEVAMGFLDEIGITKGKIIDLLEKWILSSQKSDGTMYNPEEKVKAYPHGWWWEGDSGGTLSLARFLGKWGRGSKPFFEGAKKVFISETFPDKLGVYNYPFNLYLRFAPDAEEFSEYLDKVRELLPNMLEEFKWHCPLFFSNYHWISDDIDAKTWKTEANKAVKTLKEDGGVYVPQYSKMTWWRPVWTLDMLVVMKNHGLLE